MRRLIAALVLCLLDIPVRAEDCVACVYALGDSSQPGTKTASGIPLDDNAMTAAHKSLPFGSKVKVTNKKNGHAVTVTIMDRGPVSNVEAATLAYDGPPPITRTTFPTYRAHYPGGSSGCSCRLLPRSCSLPHIPRRVHLRQQAEILIAMSRATFDLGIAERLRKMASELQSGRARARTRAVLILSAFCRD